MDRWVRCWRVERRWRELAPAGRSPASTPFPRRRGNRDLASPTLALTRVAERRAGRVRSVPPDDGSEVADPAPLSTLPRRAQAPAKQRDDGTTASTTELQLDLSLRLDR